MSCGWVRNTFVLAARLRSLAACWRGPMPGAAAISMVNAGLEGFGRAAALELGNEKIRVNVVSPPWVTETLIAYRMDPANGLPAAEVAKAYVKSVEGEATGLIIDARRVHT